MSDACTKELKLCEKALIDGYQMVLTPFYMLGREPLSKPNTKFKFGQFVSYFSRLVSRSKDGTFSKTNELSVHDELLMDFHFLDIWYRMTNDSNLFSHKSDISIFELPNLLEYPLSKGKTCLFSSACTDKFIAPRLQHRKQCNVVVYNKFWVRWLEQGKNAFQ